MYLLSRFFFFFFCYRIDVYNSKDVKESIFLIDARESQKALIALAQSSQAGNATQNSIPGGGPINIDYSNEKVVFKKKKKDGHNIPML